MDDTRQQLEYEYRKLRYEAYSRQHEGLRSRSTEISRRYDGAILALAGGGLALSVTFLEKIAPHPQSWTLILLGLAWLHLTLALLLELHALASAQTMNNEQIVALNSSYHAYLRTLPNAAKLGDVALGERAARLRVEKSKRRTQRLNYWSLLALTAGILFLCAFSFLNLPYPRESLSLWT